MIISVVLPSRGRPQKFWEMVSSVFSLAANPEDVEIIVRLDNDDPTLSLYHQELRFAAYVQKDMSNILFVRDGRDQGYASNHEMIDDAAALSSGEFLIQFVDTARMLTPNWDQKIIEASKPYHDGIFVMRSDVRPRGSYEWSFPIISRRLFEANDKKFCLGNDPSVDRCWEQFAIAAGCGCHSGIAIWHEELRGSLDEDETAKESQPYYTELNAHWAARSKRHAEIGREFANKIRG